MSVNWGPNVNKTYSCPSFGLTGPNMNCAAPCSDNFLVTKIFFVSMPVDEENWTAEMTLSFLYSLVPTLLVMIPACYAIFMSRKQIPITPLVAAFAVGCYSVFNMIVSKLVGLIDTPYKYRPGWDPSDIAKYTQLYGNVGQSCMHSYGMPSGHSANAIGAFTWYVLELWCGWGVDKGLSTKLKTALTFAAAFVCLPVPASRIGVFDHTWLQVIVGSVEGVFLGTCMWLAMRKFVGPRLPRFCEWVNASLYCCPGSSFCGGRPLVDTYWTGDKSKPNSKPKLEIVGVGISAPVVANLDLESQLGENGQEGQPDKRPASPTV